MGQASNAAPIARHVIETYYAKKEGAATYPVFTPPPGMGVSAAAPPASKERQRWLVEKCTELGVARLRWLRTRFGQGRVPQHDKAHAWMVAALEQSRRSRIMSVDRDWSSIVDLGVFIAADLGGAPFQPEEVLTVAIGPEGGWAPDELPGSCRRVSLGKGVLRSETAAIAAAAVHAATMNQ